MNQSYTQNIYYISQAFITNGCLQHKTNLLLLSCVRALYLTFVHSLVVGNVLWYLWKEQSVVLPKLDIENTSLLVMHKSWYIGGNNAWDDIISKWFSETLWHECINVLLKSSECKHCRKSLNIYRIHPMPENMKTISLCFVRSKYSNLSCCQKANNEFGWRIHEFLLQIITTDFVKWS